MKDMKILILKIKIKKKTYKAFHKLRWETERVKKNLFFKLEEKIFIEILYNNKNFKCDIIRNEYQNKYEELFQKCFKSINKVLELAKIKKEEINEIILNGWKASTTRIKEMIKEYFNKEPLKTINPDEAIAYGATIVACIVEYILKIKN